MLFFFSFSKGHLPAKDLVWLLFPIDKSLRHNKISTNAHVIVFYHFDALQQLPKLLNLYILNVGQFCYNTLFLFFKQ